MMTPAERERLLSFVISGGGPTGIEFAAELVDMMAEEVLRYVCRIIHSRLLAKARRVLVHTLTSFLANLFSA
jgi:NADH dehydrogenase FAD-containing subunit